MAKTLLDKVGDLVTYHAFEDGKNHIGYYQADVQPLMDFAHAIREEADPAKEDPEFFCYMHVPDTVVLELKFKHGIDLLQKMTKTEERRLYYLLETEYKRFKYTNLRMHIPT